MTDESPHKNQNMNSLINFCREIIFSLLMIVDTFTFSGNFLFCDSLNDKERQ